jgi:hypothetical protein
VDPDHDQHHVGGGGDVGLAAGGQPAVLVADGLGGDVDDDLDAVAPELLAEQPPSSTSAVDMTAREGCGGWPAFGMGSRGRWWAGRPPTGSTPTWSLLVSGAGLLILRGELLAGNRGPHQLHPLPGFWS